MIPNHTNREVTTGGATATGAFGISEENAASIMTILRDTLYTDKVLAVLREYSANAWDANRDAGRAGVPIKVTLPTETEPTLTIQDFGKGLSQEDMFKVYVQYGASTKRSSDNSVGMFGIGSKSGFAYSDSFTIISRHGGKIRTFVAVLDDTDKGLINLLGEDECDPADTGITIQIPVRVKDIREFHEKALKLYRYFDPRPDINITLPPVQGTEGGLNLKNGTLTKDTHAYGGENHGWTAVMGCVPYRLDLSKVLEYEAKAGKLGSYMSYLSGTVRFGIGEVQVNASREELKYGDATKEAVVTKLHALVDEYVEATVKAIDGGKYTYWEKRMMSQVLGKMELPVPEKWKDIIQSTARVPENPAFLFYKPGHGPVVNLNIHNDSALLIVDTDRDLKGFGFGSNDYLIIPAKDTTPAAARVELDKVLEAASLTGIRIESLSSRAWFEPYVAKPYVAPRRDANPKHKVSVFVFNPARIKDYGAKSKRWDIAKRVPDAGDVFVVISKFSSLHDGVTFYEAYEREMEIARHMGATLPPVYGYKDAPTKAVDETKLVGTNFWKWRKEWRKGLVTPEVRKFFVCLDWVHTAPVDYGDRASDKHRGHVVGALGRTHPLSQILLRQKAAGEFINKSKVPTYIIKVIREAVAPSHNPHFTEISDSVKTVVAHYPLLNLPEIGTKVLWGSSSKEWSDYVKTVDAVSPPPALPVGTNIEDEPNERAPEVQHVEREPDGCGVGEAAHGAEGNAELPPAEDCAA